MSTDTIPQPTKLMQAPARMNPAIKSLWIAALRSGAYTQGRAELHDPDDATFCCLGVLCDLHRVQTRAHTWDATGHYYDAGYLLPEEVMRWAGIEDECATFTGISDDAAGANDRGDSFSEIADLIEEYL